MRLTFIYLFALSKVLDDVQSFLGYVFSTELSFHILFASASRQARNQLWTSRGAKVFWVGPEFLNYAQQFETMSNTFSEEGLSPVVTGLHHVHIRYRMDYNEQRAVVVVKHHYQGC